MSLNESSLAALTKLKSDLKNAENDRHNAYVSDGWGSEAYVSARRTEQAIKTKLKKKRKAAHTAAKRREDPTHRIDIMPKRVETVDPNIRYFKADSAYVSDNKRVSQGKTEQERVQAVKVIMKPGPTESREYIKIVASVINALHCENFERVKFLNKFAIVEYNQYGLSTPLGLFSSVQAIRNSKNKLVDMVKTEISLSRKH